MSEFRRRRSLVWPLVLISIGILFLLNNLGLVSWNLWSLLWRMWPVLVVAIGLDLIFGRRSGIWPAILVVLVIGMFAGALWLFDVTESAWSGEKVSKTVVQELGMEEEAEVRRSRLQPLLAVRAPSGVFEEVRVVPYLLPGACPRGSDPRSGESELVAVPGWRGRWSPPASAEPR